MRSTQRQPTSSPLLRKTVACTMAALQLVPIGLLAGAASSARAQQTPVTEFGYDPNGNLRYTIDPKGRTTSQLIDNLNRVKKQILPPPASGASRPEVAYTYDGLDPSPASPMPAATPPPTPARAWATPSRTAPTPAPPPPTWMWMASPTARSMPSTKR